MVGVAATGELVPCLTMTGLLREAGISFGNVHDEPLAELLTRGPYLGETCRTLGEFRRANPECDACPHYGRCLGGCPAMALALTGDLHGGDPSACAYYRGGYEEKAAEVLARHRG